MFRWIKKMTDAREVRRREDVRVRNEMRDRSEAIDALTYEQATLIFEFLLSRSRWEIERESASTMKGIYRQTFWKW